MKTMVVESFRYVELESNVSFPFSSFVGMRTVLVESFGYVESNVGSSFPIDLHV